MSSRKNPQHSILRALGRKKVVKTAELVDKGQEKASKYAINRAVRGMVENGLAEEFASPQGHYLRITPVGKKKLASLELTDGTMPVPAAWDGKWRVVLLDLPEARKNERESLRYLLKKAGFICLKNSAWISPYPFEHLFTNIKNDLGLTTEIMILTTDSLDIETEKVLFETFGK